MDIYTSGNLLNQYLKKYGYDKKIGFVPTMGALHKGHLSLIERSRSENEITVVSIFVNPLQFNNQEDLTLYPRPLEKDIELLKSVKCDILFQPSEQEMYPEEPILKINFGYLEEIMEGKFRPGHFSGVGVVVGKLFNKVNPGNAYFGQKDLQQITIIKRLVKDLSFNVKIHSCPIIREEDGLAMSSRNLRIRKEDRTVAGNIFKALEFAKEKLKHGIEINIVKNLTIEFLSRYPELKLEYFEIVEAESLKPVTIKGKKVDVALCIAVYLNDIRLIDNLICGY